MVIYVICICVYRSSWSLTVCGPVPNGHILDGGKVVYMCKCAYIICVRMCAYISSWRLIVCWLRRLVPISPMAAREYIFL